MATNTVSSDLDTATGPNVNRSPGSNVDRFSTEPCPDPRERLLAIDAVMCQLTHRHDWLIDRIEVAAERVQISDPRSSGFYPEEALADIFDAATEEGLSFPVGTDAEALAGWLDWKNDYQWTRERVYGLDAA